MTHSHHNKCKHPACHCEAPAGESYCSTSCKDAGEITELACQCDHPHCVAEQPK